MNRLITIVICSLALLSGCQTVGRNVTGINNFALVDDGLYRGGQPTYDGIKDLKAKGVRTVIDLRDDRVLSERKWVEDQGMAYVNIGCDASRVEPAKIERFLREMDAAQKPVFVHCYHGRDRTGLAVAVYRMVVQKWPRKAALQELYAHGYHWAAFPGIARYLQTFDPGQFKQAADAGGG